MPNQSSGPDDGCTGETARPVPLRCDRAPRYTLNFHGAATVTNLATGRAFTFTWDHIDQDMRTTDNGDGTLSILGHSPGSERARGPEGQLLDVKAGLFKWVILVDHGGTPADVSDDTFMSIEFLSGPAVYSDFCEDFRNLTG